MWRLGGNDALDFEFFMLESHLLVLFLPAFLPSLGVIGSGHWGVRGLSPNSVRHPRVPGPERRFEVRVEHLGHARSRSRGSISSHCRDSLAPAGCESQNGRGREFARARAHRGASGAAHGHAG